MGGTADSPAGVGSGTVEVGYIVERFWVRVKDASGVLEYAPKSVRSVHPDVVAAGNSVQAAGFTRLVINTGLAWATLDMVQQQGTDPRVGTVTLEYASAGSVNWSTKWFVVPNESWSRVYPVDSLPDGIWPSYATYPAPTEVDDPRIRTIEGVEVPRPRRRWWRR